MSRLSLLAALPIALALAAGACAAPNATRISAMTQKTTPSAAATTRTWCIGRFLIDMPASARLSGGSYKYNFEKINKPEAMELKQFESEADRMEDELRTSKHRVEGSRLRAVRKPESASRIFAFWEREYTRGAIELKGMRWVGGYRFTIDTSASASKQDLALQMMTDGLSRLRPRADDDIPTEPGYCFEGGFIADAAWKNERVGVDFRFADIPDATFSITIFPLSESKFDKPLLERQGGVLQQLGSLATGIRSLRKGERDIGPFKGQESLVTAPNSGGHRGHLFTWETQGEGTLQRPFIELEMQTSRSDGKGNAQATRLTDEEAIKLWDTIISTLRIRPTTPPKTSEAEPPKAPLGTVSTTGHPCPQSGLWCAKEGEQRFITEGEKMPKTRVALAPKLWQRVRGEHPVGQLATHWTLVAFEAAPQTVAPDAARDTPQADEQTPPATDGGSPEDRA